MVKALSGGQSNGRAVLGVLLLVIKRHGQAFAHVWCEHLHVKGHTTDTVYIEILKSCEHFHVYVKGHITNADISFPSYK